MSVRFKRKKPRSLLLSVLYKGAMLPWASDSFKLKLFLKLEWIFSRLAYEFSFKVIPEKDHPHFGKENRSFLLAQIKPGDTVIDLGSANGVMTAMLAEKAKQVYGIDHDARAVHRAKERYKATNIEFIAGNAEQFLAREDRRFNVLVLSHILEHIEDPAGFLKKFTQNFDRIYIEVPDYESNTLNLYRTNLNTDFQYTDEDHIWEFDRDSLLRIIGDAGLKVVLSEYRLGVQKYWCEHQ